MDCSKLLASLLFVLPVATHAQDSLHNKLKEVHITDKQQSDFGHMRQVDGMKITAGKKTEVIDVKNLTVNKANNNTRQVYAKIGGLNIFENDGSGLQLSIGGRGLDPNRTSNFNVRQNGYDISADVLGYPESYYTPPAEALSKIEVLKGASSLQYGTQFGGLLNFEMVKPGSDKKFSLESRQSAGSYGFFGSYNAISGTIGKIDYVAYGHYKRGDGWRANSNFESFNAYADVHYRINDKNMLGIEYTHLNYLAQQPGGLDDRMFEQDPRQSNRARNWFAVKWNLIDAEWNYNISARTRWQTRVSSLMAERKAIGYRPNIVSRPDNNDPRDLLLGEFNNTTFESRFLHRYNVRHQQQVLLAGIRAYQGRGYSKQGDVLGGSGPDFNFEREGSMLLSDYKFPNTNVAAFAEHIIRLSPAFNITPGVRVEYIRTQAQGSFRHREVDLRGVPVLDTIIFEDRVSPRSFVLGGVGVSYKPDERFEAYGNLSQNYRSVTFNDMQIVNPSLLIDSNMKDERGWTSDVGIRGNITSAFRYDASFFYLYYANRIGEVMGKRNNRVYRRRGNLGTAHVYGVETFMELNMSKLWNATEKGIHVSIYNNLALTKSAYLSSADTALVGNELEYVPLVNWKTGLQTSFRQFRLTYQVSYLSKQFADATNAESGGQSGVNGAIHAYMLIDLSAGWTYKWLALEASVNNLANVAYFTRRATGYPGPGIIPGDGRAFFLTAGVKL